MIARILVIEDDERQVALYRQALAPYDLEFVASASEGVETLRRELPDLILLDHVLKGGELGLEALPKIREIAAHVPLIIVSGTLDIGQQLEALQGPKRAHYLLEKPVDLDQLDATIETALTECGFAETVSSLRSLERSEKIDATEPERRFTERLWRQHAMLQRLRGHHSRPNVSALSRDYGVSRKTIIRDLQDLTRRGQISPDVYTDWESQSPAE